MKRAFDITLALAIIPFAVILMILIAIAVKTTSKGPVIYFSNRVGKGKTIFSMAKVRTMLIDTPPVATHLLENPDTWLTPVGGYLRKRSLDEIPQLWNVLLGDMSFVGPRPALFNQDDLVAMRDELGIYELTPGVTGWAQINGRDEIPLTEKVRFEAYYRENRSFLFDMRILWLTIKRVLMAQDVKH